MKQPKKTNEMLIKELEELKSENQSAKNKYESEIGRLNAKISELQNSGGMYQRIVETATEGILTIDKDYNISYANKQLTVMLGYSLDELIGRNVDSFIAPDKVDFQKEQAKNRRKGIDAVYETCFIKKDSERLWTLISARAVMNNEGEFNGSLAIINDITRYKWAEAKLEEQNNFLALLINHMPNLVFWKDKDLIFQGCNQKFAEIIGVSDPKMIIGKKEISFNRISSSNVSSEILDAEVLKSGEGIYGIEEKYYDERQNEKIILTSKIPIKDNDNNILGILEICIDMTEQKNAEIALRKNEKLLSTLIDFLPDATLAIDKDKKLIIWNKAIEEMTGIPAEEMVGKGDYIYTIPFYGKARPQLMDLFWNPEHDITSEYPFIKKEGEVLVTEAFANALYDNKGAYIWVKAAPLWDSDGNFIGAIECLRDITETKRAEKTLSESEAKYRSIFENTGAASMIIEEDTTISLANEEYINLSGFSKEEIENIKSWTECIVPEDVERMKKYHYDRRISNDLAPRRYEFKFLRRNGEIRNMICTVAMIPGTKKSIASMVDLTERTKAEEALILSEARFRALFDNNPTMYFILDEHGFVVAVNNFGSSELGYSIDELIGKPVSLVIYDEDRDIVWKKLKSALEHPMEINRWEFRKVRKDGSIFWVREASRAVIGAEGSLLLFVVCEDINEQKEKDIELLKAKELAEKSNKLKDGFLASISHEIRTPLTGILGMTNLIHDSFASYVKKDEERFFVSIEKSSKRLMDSVDMIINFSRLQAGDIEVKPEVIALSPLIYSLVDIYKPVADEKAFKLYFYSDLDDDRAYADPTSIETSIGNLLDNAVKYTNSGSVVITMYRNESGKLCVDIRDTGIGISEEYFMHLFEPYTQEVTGYSRPYEGLGLGLPIVKKLLDLNNVSINVNSKKGVGTQFSLCFNNKIPEKQPAEEKNIQQMPPLIPEQKKDGEKNVILIVEDDETNQLLFKSYIRKYYEVIIASDANEALNSLKNRKVELVLMDISLKQGMNGLELTKFIREGTNYPHIPILVVTGHAFPADRRKAFEAGCNDFLVKPFKAEKLLEKMKILLQQKQ
jgi:PAS domain S-box-containing protein